MWWRGKNWRHITSETRPAVIRCPVDFTSWTVRLTDGAGDGMVRVAGRCGWRDGAGGWMVRVAGRCGWSDVCSVVAMCRGGVAVGGSLLGDWSILCDRLCVVTVSSQCPRSASRHSVWFRVDVDGKGLVNSANQYSYPGKVVATATLTRMWVHQPRLLGIHWHRARGLMLVGFDWNTCVCRYLCV